MYQDILYTHYEINVYIKHSYYETICPLASGSYIGPFAYHFNKKKRLVNSQTPSRCIINHDVQII